ncbi:DUF4265 domain-containing protein [Gilvimarinus agarilyticus]|uniref:DUF4265 domain-containing protein n=1 Tax=Gilvimarinus agarilyticus TaxID=679259 RepID=UPI0005A258F5|nr:DUF4265 domain-containing protein [Gilvimarinus agarilyticus]
MQTLQAVELFAGLRPDGQPMVERLPVKVLEDNSVQLVRSPAFVKGIASGDVIRCQPDKREFEILKHSGNIAVQVFCKGDIQTLTDQLSGPVAKLGGDLDIETPRMLVYTLHVSCGFTEIEAVFNAITGDDSAWQYGNVYDPADGTTPLNWWLDILKPE